MEIITIGVIVNTHGLKGTLKVKSFTDFKEERYKKGNPLYIAFRNELIPVTVKKYKTVKNLDYIDFEEFTNINDCEKYKGSELRMKESQMHNLPEDEFYWDELINMDIYTDEYIGKCVDVREVPRGELIVLRREGKKDTLIPFMRQFIKEVDKENKRIILNEWEGLL